MFNFLNKIFPKKFNDRKLAQETFCIIDTETTGLEVRSGDKIISFAGVKVKSFKLLDAIFDQLIDTDEAFSPGCQNPIPNHDHCSASTWPFAPYP